MAAITDEQVETVRALVAAVPSGRVTNYDATPHVAADARAYHFATPAVLEDVGIFPDAGSVASD